MFLLKKPKQLDFNDENIIEQTLKKRLRKLQKQLKDEEAILISNYQDIYYFSSYEQLVPEEREAFLCVTKNDIYLIHCSFSPTPDWKFISKFKGAQPNKLAKNLTSIKNYHQLKKIYFDETSLFVNEYKTLQKIEELTLDTLNKDWIWQQRLIKDQDELGKLFHASQISSQAFTRIKKKIKAGITEKQVAKILEKAMAELGSEKTAFPTIIAFGKNIALPHHQPGNTKLENEMPILFDFGASFGRYGSDMSRTFWFGNKPSSQFLEIENIINKAYQQGLAIIRKRLYPAKSHLLNEKDAKVDQSRQALNNTFLPLAAKEIDQAARLVIEKHGYGKQFIHTSGHGIGLDIHEPPSLSWINDQVIKKKMVFSLEPGIYLEGQLGYRYENTLYLDEENVLELTK